MIQLYPKGTADFTVNGIELHPEEAEVTWQIAGRYDFKMTIPREACEGVTFDYGQIIRASVPQEQVAAIDLGTVSYYETNTSAKLYSQIPSTQRVAYQEWCYTRMGEQVTYAVGAKVTYSRQNYQCTNWDSSSQWAIVPPGSGHPFWTQIPNTIGNAGKEIATLASGTSIMKVRDFNSTYMEAATLTGYQGYIKISECTATGESEERTVPAFEITDQLFTINKIDKQTSKHSIIIEAEHISYQLGRTMLDECNVAGVTPATALLFIAGAMQEEYQGGLYTGIDEGEITADWSWKNAQSAILDPQKGLLKLLSARIIRNNRDVYIVPNPEEDPSYDVRYGVNLESVHWDGDVSGIVTRIYPFARREDGTRLTLPEKYIDSELQVPYCRPEPLDTKLKVGDKITNSDGTEVELTENEVITRMRQAAQDRFSIDHCDRAEVTLELDWIHMPDTEEYRQYINLRNAAPAEWVRVTDGPMGVSSVVQMTGYTFDPILLRYKKTTFGDKKQKPSIAGYDLKDGAVGGRALAAGAVSGQNIQAGAITAREIEAGSITADQIASRIITAELIAAGAIRADSIDTDDLTAIQATLQIASIANAQIAVADIGYAQIKDATVQNLIARDALTDRYYIDKLQVRNLQSVYATVGELVVKAADNNYYKLTVNSSGEIETTQVTPTSAEITAGVTSDGHAAIIETDLTVQDLAASNVKAINALIDKLTAARINVDELFARTAFINKLNTTDIESTANLTIKTGGTFTVQSGNFEIDSSGNVSMTGEIHAEAGGSIAGWDINAASMTGNKTGIAKTTNDSDIAFWAGNATAGSANFRVTQGGDVYLRSLQTLDEQGQATTVDLGNYPFWKLSYATVKSMSVTGNTLTIVTTAGTVNFSKAATTAHLVGSWGSGEYTVYADNDPDVLPVSSGTLKATNMDDGSTSGQNAKIRVYTDATIVSDFTLAIPNVYSAGHTAGVADGAAGVTLSAGGWQNGANRVSASNGKYVDVTLPSFTTSQDASFTSHKKNVYFSTASVTGPVKTAEVDATSEYNAGVTAGAAAVTLSAGGWQGGANRVSASNGKYVDVTLPSFTTSGGTSFSSHKTTVYFSTASVSGALASKEVDATSEYNAGVTAGANGVTGSAGSWSNGSCTVTLSNGKTVTVSVGNASGWSLSNTADKTAVASVTVAGKTFTNTFTQNWINHGDYNQGWNEALTACGIPGGGDVRTGGTYYANLYVMGQSGPSRVGSGYVGVNTVHVSAK